MFLVLVMCIVMQYYVALLYFLYYLSSTEPIVVNFLI